MLANALICQTRARFNLARWRPRSRSSAALRAAGAKGNLQIAQLTLGRACRLSFNGTVFFDQRAPEWRQRRPAAARAARLSGDDLLAEAAVEIVNQKPRPPI